MFKTLCVIVLSIPQDTIVVDTTTSLMFKKSLNTHQVARFKYQHQQGFFCDFEDKINKNKRFNLNVGVGDQ